MRGGFLIIPIFIAAFVALILTGPAFSQETQTGVPPTGARPLSEILAKVEKRDQFSYIDEIRWNDDGYYEVTYFTSDKAKVEINYNPVTGEPQ
jgi:hypothetical protein